MSMSTWSIIEGYSWGKASVELEQREPALNATSLPAFSRGSGSTDEKVMTIDGFLPASFLVLSISNVSSSML